MGILENAWVLQRMYTSTVGVILVAKDKETISLALVITELLTKIRINVSEFKKITIGIPSDKYS